MTAHPRKSIFLKLLLNKPTVYHSLLGLSLHRRRHPIDISVVAAASLNPQGNPVLQGKFMFLRFTGVHKRHLSRNHGQKAYQKKERDQKQKTLLCMLQCFSLLQPNMYQQGYEYHPQASLYLIPKSKDQSC